MKLFLQVMTHHDACCPEKLEVYALYCSMRLTMLTSTLLNGCNNTVHNNGLHLLLLLLHVRVTTAMQTSVQLLCQRPNGIKEGLARTLQTHERQQTTTTRKLVRL